MRRKRHQYAEEKRWVFSFDSVKEESEDECLTDHRSDVLKGSLRQGSLSEYQRLSEESEER